MAAITIIMIFTPFGMIPNPAGPSLTISHIPTILTAVLFGPFMGAAVGFIFGVAGLVRAIIAPHSPFDLLFMNPLVSVLPRVLVGFGTGFIYALFSKWQNNMGMAIGAAAGSLINTFAVLGMVYILYRARVAEMLDAAMADVMPWILGVVTTSGLLEMAAAVIVVFPIAKALKKYDER